LEVELDEKFFLGLGKKKVATDQGFPMKLTMAGCSRGLRERERTGIEKKKLIGQD